MRRDEYMDNSDCLKPNGEVDDAKRTAKHRAYYAQFVDESVKYAVLRGIGIERLLKSRDFYFNDIPLHEWDRLAGAQGFKVTAPVILQFGTRMKERGDFITLAGAVAMLKEAARQIVENHNKKLPEGEQWLDIPAFLRRDAS